MDGALGLGAAIELVDEPSVDSAKGEAALLVGLLDSLDVLNEPKELNTARVGGERKTAEVLDGISAILGLEVADNGLGTGIGPDDGVVERLAGFVVPNKSGLALVGNADGADVVLGEAEPLELAHSTLNALLNRVEQRHGVVLVPS